MFGAVYRHQRYYVAHGCLESVSLACAQHIVQVDKLAVLSMHDVHDSARNLVIINTF